MSINWTNVKSSNLESVALEGQTLHVRFKTGGVWSYDGCTQDLYNNLLRADSPGKFFHQHLRALGGRPYKPQDDGRQTVTQAPQTEMSKIQSEQWPDWVKGIGGNTQEQDIPTPQDQDLWVQWVKDKEASRDSPSP